MKIKALALGLIVGTMALAGCGGSGSEGGGKISVVGSTTVAEPMEKLAGEYKAKVADANIEVQGNGSSAGIKAASDGTAQLGMSSRELSEEEKGLGLTETVIAHDGIAVVVNTVNGVSDLSKAQIKDIYEGKIANWSEVGGNDAPIVVVTREAGSGTRGAFEEILGLVSSDGASTIAPTALVGEGTGSIMATVASKENAIGYISLGYMDETVKPVSIEGVIPTNEAVSKGEYTISRPLLLLSSDKTTEEAKAFVDYIMGEEGQSIMGENYIAVK